jgi:flagellar biosynthetic protein FliR
VGLEVQSLGTFLVLCRIGSCFMVLPGFATARVPARVRLHLALVLALLVAPMIDLEPSRKVASSPVLVQMILAECITGAAIGLVVRLLIEALEFAVTAVSNYIGLVGLVPNIDGGDAQPVLSSLVAVTGTLVLLILGMPQLVLIGLVDSYSVLPLGTMPMPAILLARITDLLSTGFLMGLRLAAPFVIYCLLVNAMFALAGKVVPQIQSYFLSTPFLVLGGLAMFYLVGAEVMRVFADVAAREMQRL